MFLFLLVFNAEQNKCFIEVVVILLSSVRVTDRQRTVEAAGRRNLNFVLMSF